MELTKTKIDMMHIGVPTGKIFYFGNKWVTDGSSPPTGRDFVASTFGEKSVFYIDPNDNRVYDSNTYEKMKANFFSVHCDKWLLLPE